jgi:hypothetical protein
MSESPYLDLSASFVVTLWLPQAFADSPPLETTAEFKLMVSLLPSTYEAKAYADFVQSYGTHYMKSARMGGMALISIYINRFA